MKYCVEGINCYVVFSSPGIIMNPRSGPPAPSRGGRIVQSAANRGLTTLRRGNKNNIMM